MEGSAHGVARRYSNEVQLDGRGKLYIYEPYQSPVDSLRGGERMIDYSPLWDTMKRKGVTQYALIQAGIDRRTLDWLKKNRNITMLTLEKLCTILECSPNEVVRFEK